MSIYQDIILDHYRNPRNYGRIKRPSKKIEVSNPLCGDIIRIELILDKNDKTVRDVKFTGNGCAISQAASSLLTEFIKGKSEDQLRKLDKQFMMKLLGIKLGPNRIKCALLPLEAVQKLI